MVGMFEAEKHSGDYVRPSPRLQHILSSDFFGQSFDYFKEAFPSTITTRSLIIDRIIIAVPSKLLPSTCK